MRVFLLFILVNAFLVFNAAGQIIRLNDYNANKNLGKRITYYEDKSAALGIDQIQKLANAGKFTPGKKDVLNFGRTKSAFWLKITYISKESKKNYLIIDAPSMEHIDVYAPLTSENRLHLASGALSRSQKGVQISNNFVFHLPADKSIGSPKNVYVRLTSNNIILAPVKLISAEGSKRTLDPRYQIEYIYMGILFTLFFFNIFLYFSLKDVTYLYYSFYVLTLGLYVILYLRGYSYLFGDEFRILLNRYPYVLLSISIVAALLFSRKFLNLRKTVPSMLMVYNILFGVCIFLILMNAVGFKSFSAGFAQYFTLLITLVIWVSGVKAYKNGHAPAKYFTIAWFFIGVSIVGFILSIVGVINSSEYAVQLVPVGSTLELLLLSFALGDRYRAVIQNEKAVRDENLFLIKSQNQKLEDLVEKRTQMLTDSVHQLEASNAVKNKLLSIIAHDLRTPFNSLVSIFSLKDMDLLSFEELKMMLNENRKNIETIQNTLNNLLHWAMSQMDGIKTIPSEFEMKTLIEDLMLVYVPVIERKGLDLELEITPDIYKVYADENQIKLILRNLVDNAIKFTPAGQNIKLFLKQADQFVTVSISNTFSNNDQFEISNLYDPNGVRSTYGTENEKGIGLGLHLCHEYVKRNGGILNVKTSGNEILFSFNLPSANS